MSDRRGRRVGPAEREPRTAPWELRGLSGPGGTVVKREASDLDWVQESRAGIGAKLSLDFAGGKHRVVEKNRERRKFAGQAARAQFWVRSLGLEHMAASNCTLGCLAGVWTNRLLRPRAF